MNQFEKLANSDPENLIDIAPLTGEVINNQILDFEVLKEVTFQVGSSLVFCYAEHN